MSVLMESLRAVQRNVGALGLYVALTVGPGTVKLCGDVLVKGAGDSIDTGYLRVYFFLSGLALALFFALAQTLAFTQFGKEIDRPLWKISGPREALARFFPLWLVLNLVALAVLQLSVRVAAGESNLGLAGVLLMAFFIVTILQVPVGACLMFTRCAHWSQVSESLAPLAREFPKVLVFLFINFIQLVLFLSYSERLANNPESRTLLWLSPALDVFLAYCDCVVFSGIWIICKIHRDSAEDVDLDL